MNVKIKKLHPNAVIPQYAKKGDAGMDLVAVDVKADNLYTEYKTGLAMEIPEGYVGLIFPRSSICNKSQYLGNAVGVVDSGYRGEISVRMKLDFTMHLALAQKHGEEKVEDYMYDVGEKVAQMIIIPYPQIEFEEVDELSETERGTGGYGSSDVKNK